MADLTSSGTLLLLALKPRFARASGTLQLPHYTFVGQYKSITPAAKRLPLSHSDLLPLCSSFFSILQPQVEQKEVLKLKNKVVCLIDNSKSMTLKGGDTGISRFQLAADFF